MKKVLLAVIFGALFASSLSRAGNNPSFENWKEIINKYNLWVEEGNKGQFGFMLSPKHLDTIKGYVDAHIALRKLEQSPEMQKYEAERKEIRAKMNTESDKMVNQKNKTMQERLVLQEELAEKYKKRFNILDEKFKDMLSKMEKLSSVAYGIPVKADIEGKIAKILSGVLRFILPEKEGDIAK